MIINLDKGFFSLDEYYSSGYLREMKNIAHKCLFQEGHISGHVRDHFKLIRLDSASYVDDLKHVT